jgi:hypothetical protein
MDRNLDSDLNQLVLAYSLHSRRRERIFVRVVALALLLILAACGGRSSLSNSESTAQSVAASSGQFAPTLLLDPPSGYAGVYVKATGAAWPQDMMVIVGITAPDGKSMPSLASKDTDNAGNLTTGFLYPIDSDWVQPGIYTVIAESADGKYQVKVPFTVVHPGEQITSTPVATAASVTPTTPVVAAVAASATSTPAPTATPIATPTVQPTATNSPTPKSATAQAASAADNRPPVVNAALVPVTEGPGPYRQLRADFTATDPDNNLSAVVALLQSPALGSLRNVQLRVSDKIEIRVNPGRFEIRAPDPQALLDSIRQFGGIQIQNGQLIDYMPSPERVFKLEEEDGKLTIQAAALHLQVTATDSTGLSQQVIVSPPASKPGHGHDKGNDKNSNDKNNDDKNGDRGHGNGHDHHDDDQGEDD